MAYNINKREITNELQKTIDSKIIVPLKIEITSTLSSILEKNISSIDGFNKTIESIVEEMNNAISQEKMPDLEKKMLYKKKIKDLQISSQDIEEDWENLSDIFTVEKIDTQAKTDVAA